MSSSPWHSLDPQGIRCKFFIRHTKKTFKCGLVKEVTSNTCKYYTWFSPCQIFACKCAEIESKSWLNGQLNNNPSNPPKQLKPEKSRTPEVSFIAGNVRKKWRKINWCGTMCASGRPTKLGPIWSNNCWLIIDQSWSLIRGGTAFNRGLIITQQHQI